ncbi:MAG TPA: ABC transporter substrate-binding protein [Candidatus Binatia bacterium]|nr:ABC transporter substrate-binding protein [Candidatus Binatia bacterium]
MNKTVSYFALGAVLFALCASAEAQQPKKVPRVGFLIAGHPPGWVQIKSLAQGLRQLGWIEGQNIAFESRFAEAKSERLPELAAELVQLKVDVIVAGSGAEHAAKQASRRIPIVVVFVGDPVSEGLVRSLARPGGNITGLTRISPQLSGKRLELIKEAFPKVRRVALIWNPTNPSSAAEFREAEITAKSLRLKLQSLELRTPNDADGAFETAARERPDALVLTKDPLIDALHFRILDSVIGNRLPLMHTEGTFVEAGGLMSYGPSAADLYRRAATYVDKILKGAKPSDLPVERPMKFELVINLKTATALGLTIPQSVLYRADKVIR